MGVNITTIASLRVLIIEIGSTIILMVVEAHNSTYKGEITPVKPIYFRPFIGATRYTPYKTRVGAPILYTSQILIIHLEPPNCTK